MGNINVSIKLDHQPDVHEDIYVTIYEITDDVESPGNNERRKRRTFQTKEFVSHEGFLRDEDDRRYYSKQVRINFQAAQNTPILVRITNVRRSTVHTVSVVDAAGN